MIIPGFDPLATGRSAQVPTPEAFEVSTRPTAGVPPLTVRALVERLLVETLLVAVRFGTVSAPVIVSPERSSLLEKEV